MSKVSLSPICHVKETQAGFKLAINHTIQLKQTLIGMETLNPSNKLKLIPFIKESQSSYISQ